MLQIYMSSFEASNATLNFIAFVTAVVLAFVVSFWTVLTFCDEVVGIFVSIFNGMVTLIAAWSTTSWILGLAGLYVETPKESMGSFPIWINMALLSLIFLTHYSHTIRIKFFPFMGSICKRIAKISLPSWSRVF